MIGAALMAATVALTVVSQLLFKWRIDEAGPVPDEGRVGFALGIALDPWVITSMLLALAASVTYGAALTRLELSVAYPVMSLSFAAVLLFAAALFDEPLTGPKVAGVALICLGVVVASR
jgi:multidrug transporter EmrE-like cation transporter